MGLPITVFLVALMVFTYLMFAQFLQHSCTAVKSFDPKQWFFAMLPHENKDLFIYQIISFNWKGMLLEGSIGSRKFASKVLKLFLITEGMIVMAMEGWLLWNARHIYLLCPGFIWRMLFGMYGFILPTYKNWTKLVIASILTVELAVVYFLYPVLLLAGPACGILSGVIYSYVPQLLINCWNKERNTVEYPTRLVWRCLSCSSPNGVFLHSCDHCQGPRQGGSESSLTRTVSPLALVQITETRNFDMTGLIWNCESCSFENGVYLNACERCTTLRLISDQNMM